MYYPCDECNDDCKICHYGNPCLGCVDYDEETMKCKTNGGCGAKEKKD